MMSDIVHSFLCPEDISKIPEIQTRIKTLHRLRNEVPYQSQLDYADTVLIFVQLKRSVILGKSRLSDNDDKERATIWGLLFAILDSMHVSPSIEEHANSTTDLIRRLGDLCFQLDEKELAAMESAMSTRSIALAPDPLHVVQSAINNHISELRSKRFCSEVEYIVQNKVLPSSYIQYRTDLWGHSKPTGDGNWSSFLLLAERVLSSKQVKPECENYFHSLLSTLVSLSERSRASMRSALSGSDGTLTNNTQAIRRQIVESLQRANDLVAERALIGKVRNLKRRTALRPENVQVEYPANNLGDLPQVQSFLMSNKMEAKLTGFGSVIVARKVLTSCRHRLPYGTESHAGGVGRGSYIYLRKPLAAERKKWLQYRSEKIELSKAQAELKQVQSRLRRMPEEGEKQVAIKRQKTNCIHGERHDKSYASSCCLGEEESPTKVLEEVITIDD